MSVNAPKELVDRFVARTNKHINRVIKNIQRLEEKYPGRFPGVIDRAFDHDKSKFSDPELTPYIWLTEFYRCKDCGEKFEYPDGMKDKVDTVTLHHLRRNCHHPEFHDPEKKEIELGRTRDNLEEKSDATAMPAPDIAEMVCDWAAMSQELGTSLRDWADKKVNKRWKFTPKQVKLIDELVEFFEPKDFEGKLEEVMG